MPVDTPSGGPFRHWLARTVHEALPPQLHGESTLGFASCSLQADLRAPGAARGFVRSTLDSWGMASLVDGAALIVSELLGNALRHGEQEPAPDDVAEGEPLLLGLLRRERTVLCAVCDRNPDVPELRHPGPLAQSGRGLHIIETLSECWGWTRPGPAGKAVWAAIPTVRV